MKNSKEILSLILPGLFSGKEMCGGRWCDGDCGECRYLKDNPRWFVATDFDVLTQGNDTEQEAWDNALKNVRDKVCEVWGMGDYEETLKVAKNG